MTTSSLDEIAARHAATTGGVWQPGHLSDDSHECNCACVISETMAGAICDVPVDNGLPISDGGNDCAPLEEAKANLRFIAHAHQDIPFLLDLATTQGAEIERLRAAVETAYETFKHYGDLHAAKPDPVKAKRNYDLAVQMGAALSAGSATG